MDMLRQSHLVIHWRDMSEVENVLPHYRKVHYWCIETCPLYEASCIVCSLFRVSFIRHSTVYISQVHVRHPWPAPHATCMYILTTMIYCQKLWRSELCFSVQLVRRCCLSARIRMYIRVCEERSNAVESHIRKL